MEAIRILQGMIEIYQNDFSCGYDDEDKEEIRPIFTELIIETTRYVNNYRYCSKKDCPCSPERSIASLVKKNNEVIMKKFFGGTCGLTEVPMRVIRDFLNGFEQK